MTQTTPLENGAYWQPTFGGPNVVIYPDGYQPPKAPVVQAVGEAALENVFTHHDDAATGDNQFAHTD